MRKNINCLLLAPNDALPEHTELFEALSDDVNFDFVRVDTAQDRPKAMLGASFVIADLTGNDPDVLYDLGVAHTFGKRVFLVKRDLKDTPYDLAGNRIVILGDPPDRTRVREALEQFLGVPQVIGPVRLFMDKAIFFGENLVARRAAAFALDVLGLALFIGLLSICFDPRALTAGDLRSGALPPALIVGVYGSAAYFIFVSWVLGGTLGQRALGLCVVQADYRPVTLGHCAGRVVLALFLNCAYGVSFLAATRAPGYRAFHDVLSGTIVVRRHWLR